MCTTPNNWKCVFSKASCACFYTTADIIILGGLSLLEKQMPCLLKKKKAQCCHDNIQKLLENHGLFPVITIWVEIEIETSSVLIPCPFNHYIILKATQTISSKENFFVYKFVSKPRPHTQVSQVLLCLVGFTNSNEFLVKQTRRSQIQKGFIQYIRSI